MKKYFKSWMLDIVICVVAIGAVVGYLRYKVGTETCKLEAAKWGYSISTGDFSSFSSTRIITLDPHVKLPKWRPGIKRVYTITSPDTRKQLQKVLSTPSWKEHYQFTFATKKYINTGCPYTSHYELPNLPAWILHACEPACIIHPEKRQIISVTNRQETAEEIIGLLKIYKDW